MYLIRIHLLYLFMAKKMQTFKLDPELIEGLKKRAKEKGIAYNKMAEDHLRKLIKK